MENENCGSCKLEYDDTIKTPLIIKHCKHTVCETCIETLIQTAKNVKLSFIRCPICDGQTFFSPNPNNFSTDFPKNKVLLSILAPKLAQTYCGIHKTQKRQFMCLNPACQFKEKICIECCKAHSSNCLSKLIIQEDSFSTFVKFKKNEKTELIFDKNVIIANVRNEIENLGNYFVSLIEAVYEKITLQKSQLENIQKDQALFLQNKHLFSCEASPVLTDLTFEFKHAQIYQKFTCFLTEMLHSRIWTETYKYTNFQLLKFFDEQKNEISGLFPENTLLLSKITQMNFQIRNDLILENLKNPPIFTFDKFFGNLKSKLANVQVRFVEIECRLFDKDMKYFAQKSIFKAFSQEKLTPALISASIANDFNEEFKSGFWNFLNGNKNYSWNAMFGLTSFAPLKLGTKFIRMKNGKYELTIFTQE